MTAGKLGGGRLPLTVGLERAAAPESVARAPHAFPLARPPRGANLRDLAFTFTLARAVWKSVPNCATLTNIHAHG